MLSFRGREGKIRNTITILCKMKKFFLSSRKMKIYPIYRVLCKYSKNEICQYELSKKTSMCKETTQGLKVDCSTRKKDTFKEIVKNITSRHLVLKQSEINRLFQN